MDFKKSPECLLIFYTVNYEYGNFTPCINNSIPFYSKEEAEEYRDNLLKNVANIGHVQIAIISA